MQVPPPPRRAQNDSERPKRLFCNNCGMKHHISKIEEGEISRNPIKTLSMEEKTPTMPGVMYLKCLKSIRKMPGSQVRIWKDHCEGPETPIGPHCGCAHVHIHDRYDRHIICAGEDGGVRRIVLRVNRYKCCNCNRTFVLNCRCIGLQKHAVRTVRLDYQMAKQCWAWPGKHQTRCP